MDCSDGVCGTCKCHCASGEYDLGEDYLDEALSDDEAQNRQVLTCQMVPTSDCVIDVPVAAAQCKTTLANIGAQVRQVNLLSDTAIELVVALDEPLAFLPGQYVNIQVPGTPHVRAYSFSSQPGSLEGRFLIRNVPGGMMSQWLTQRARPGDRLTLSGPMGSFYLRHGERPLLMLAGGTGLAPLLSMLHTLQTQGSQRPVMLLYGVTRDCDLVKTDALDTFTQQLTGYRWLPVVADENSTCPQRGFVTDHLDDAMLNNGDVDIYLCGPPPMVNAVATALRDRGITRRGSGMRNLSPARARRHKEAKCVLPIKSSSSPARRRALAARRRSRRLQKARLLLLIDRSSYVHELAATLAQSGCLVLALEADLEAWESTEQAFAAGVAHFGRIDVLINNVGGTIWARPFAEYQPEQIEKRSAARCSPRCGAAARRCHGC